MVNPEHSKLPVCAGCWVLVVLVVSGCSSPFNRKVVFSDLESQDPAVRIRAIKWAVDNSVRSAVPHLVDSLQSEDEAVRFYPIEALRRITGTDCGYDYKTRPDRRAAAVKRWREFLDSKEWQDGKD